MLIPSTYKNETGKFHHQEVYLIWKILVLHDSHLKLQARQVLRSYKKKNATFKISLLSFIRVSKYHIMFYVWSSEACFWKAFLLFWLPPKISLVRGQNALLFLSSCLMISWATFICESHKQTQNYKWGSHVLKAKMQQQSFMANETIEFTWSWIGLFLQL